MITPVEYKCLVEPLPFEEVSEGGIVVVTQQMKEREQMGQIQAKLLAVGGNAFDDWKDPKPEVGDTCYIAKYAGYIIKCDGNDQRIINDKDICAVVRS